MLKKVFCRFDYSLTHPDWTRLSFELREMGIVLETGYYKEDEDEMRIPDIVMPEILLVTDSAGLYRHYLEMGGYALLYLRKEKESDGTCVSGYAAEQPENLEASYFVEVYQRLAGLPCTVIRTRRCVIREMTEGDLEALYDIYAEPSITRYMENLYEDREEEREYIRGYIKNVYAFYGYGMWIVERREDGQVIGRAGLEQREEGKGIELGFVIGVPWQRQGYAAEVCLAILQFAMEELEEENVYCFVMPENKASAALCRKLGLRKKESRMISNILFDEFEW